MFDFLKKGKRPVIKDAKLEKFRLALEKKELALKEKERLIRHAEALEEELARYKEFEEEINRKTAEWKNAEKIFADQQKSIDKKNKGLKEKEDELKKREAKVAEKSKEFELREDELLRHENALEKSEEKVRLAVAQLESKKLKLEEQLLAQKRLIADGQRELRDLEAQKEFIIVKKVKAERLLAEGEEFSRVLAEKDAGLKNNETELLKRIKAFEREQSVRLREVDNRIESEERSAQERLNKLRKEYEAVDLERVELEKTIASQHELVAGLGAQRRDIEKQLSEKNAKIDIAKRELRVFEENLKQYEDMQWELEKRKNKVEKEENKWNKKFETSQQKLRQKDVDLLQRERTLASKASSIVSRERQLASIRAEMTKLELLKTESLAVLKQRTDYEAEMHNLAIENEKKLSEIHNEMQKLETNRRDFKKKERLEKNLRNLVDVLTENRKSIETDIVKMRESLALIQNEREDKLHELRSEFLIMRKEKQKIEGLVDKDVYVLKEKENEVIKMLGLLDKDRQKLEIEENSVVKKVQLLEREKKQHEIIHDKLDEREKTVVVKEKELEKQGEYLARLIERQGELKELEANVKELESQRKELESWMQRVSAELLIEPPVDKEKLVKEEPSVVSKIEENPEEALQAIARLQARKERGLAKTREVDVEVKKIIHKKVPVLLKKSSPVRLNTLLTNAKDKINNGQLGEAKILIREAEIILNKVKDSELRRNYGYDLKELKTNMKLAILA